MQEKALRQYGRPAILRVQTSQEFTVKDYL